MIGSFSISCCNFLASLTLTTQEIPVEDKLMTCLPKGLFSFFTLLIQFTLLVFGVHFVYSFVAGFTTLSCVHCFLPSSTLPLLIALFKHSRFLCCSTPSFGVLTVSPKNSSSFNIFSTSLIIFITCRNRNHMRNNVRCKGNMNNTSVIIFFNSQPCHL